MEEHAVDQKVVQADCRVAQSNVVKSEEVSSFAELLHLQWLSAALSRMGINNPTPVQAESLGQTMIGKDMVIQAETGSGKTLAFCLPLVAHLRNSVVMEDTVGLVVTPTRELAVQVARVVEELEPACRPACIIGGMSFRQQKQALETDPRIVIGTPGRVLDLIRQKLLYLGGVSFFALDEADEMLSMGFIEEVERILEKIPNEAQGVFVSATISPRVKMLAERYLKRVESLEVETSLREDGESQVRHLFTNAGLGIMDKPRRVISLLESIKPRSAIVFCNTKSDTELVEAILKRQGHDAQRLNSDLSQSQRNRIMDKLRDDNLSVLIATDLAARGIDIAQIDLVINYSLPDNTESYVHRTGRTGRAGRGGIAATIVSPVDIPRFHEIKKVLDVEFERFDES